jgi:hypothetical protein
MPIKKLMTRQAFFEERITWILLGERLPFTIFYRDRGERIPLVKKGKQVTRRVCRILAGGYENVEIEKGPIKLKLDELYRALMLVEVERSHESPNDLE